MFGTGFWGAPMGNDEHLTRERDPPPRPTKLEFPDYVPTFNPKPLTSKTSSQIRHKICHVRSFLDVTEADVELLNINLQKDAPLSSFVPADQFASRPFLFDEELQAMLDEVSVENEDAFREVLRMAPLPGRKKPRLAYARNFFGSLEDMARYFDDSQDNYYKASAKMTEETDASKLEDKLTCNDKDIEMKDDPAKSPSNVSSNSKEMYKGYRIGSGESLSPGTRISLLKNLLKTTMHRFQCRDHEPIPQPREKLVIRGVKIQSIQYSFCVARTPRDTKLARSRHVEGPVMAVATRDELRFKARTDLLSPERIPFVGERFDLFREVGCMLILANQRARQTNGKPPNAEDNWWVKKPRWGGGPTKWGQLATEIYEDEDPSWSPEERKLQEAKRERQAEERAKGLNGKPGDPLRLEVNDLIADGPASETKTNALPGILSSSNSPVPVVSVDLDLRPRKKKLRSMERPPNDEPAIKNGKRVVYVPPFKQRWYSDWQKLRPNTPTQDEKIIGKRIGAEKQAFDEVWMLTSANHHVALVKMRVHPDYLDWLATGAEVPDKEVEGMKKNALYVSRSEWYDMFKVDARREFLVALWRVFCWINRDHVPQEEFEKMRQGKEGMDMK